MKRFPDLGSVLLIFVFGVMVGLGGLAFFRSATMPLPPAPSTDGASPEVAVLRAQLETQRQYDERLVNTVYWGLGAAITLAFGLSGFGVFYTVRQSDREKTALQAELSATLRDQISQIKADLSTETTKTRQATVKWSEEMKKTLTDALENGKVAAEVAVRTAVNTQIKRLNATIDNLTYDVLRLEFEQEQEKAQNEGAGSYPGYALSRLVRMGKLAVKLVQVASYMDDTFVPPVLDGIDQILRSGYRPDANDAAEIAAVLDQLPGKFAVPIATIRRYLDAR